MNDLELVSELRADVAALSDERLAVVRARLLEAIAQTPVAHERRTWARGWKASGRRPAWAGMLAGALVALVAVVTVGGHGTAPSVSGLPKVRAALAAEVLNLAAKTVAHAAGGQPRPDQWLYQRSIEENIGQAPQADASWLRFDGGAEAFAEDGALVVERKPIIRSSGTTALDVYKRDPSPMHAYAALASLQADPQTLLATVATAASTGYDSNGLPTLGVVSVHGRDQLEFEFLVQLLWQTGGTPPPRSEAAVFRALAAIPNVTVQRGIDDAFGHPAIGLSDNGEVQLLLDPSTYAMLGLRTLSTGTAPHVPAADGASRLYPAGTVLQSMARSVVVVDAAGER